MEDDVAAALILPLCNILSTHMLLSQTVREAVYFLQGHSFTVEMEAQREVSVGGSQMH